MKLLLRLKDFQRYESGTSKRCYCVHHIIVLLVLIQQRRDSDDARSNSRADWPELRDYRLKVEIFQLGVKIAPLKTRRPHCVARKNVASIPATSVCTLTFHGIRSREKIASLLVWTHLNTHKWGFGTGMSMCTNCKTLWDKFLIRENGLYK